jgi:hypothetical protein|tara:strand:+ start:622 stop:831 length:210 start_codon:yes stop_codon:yes gene_type:complete
MSFKITTVREEYGEGEGSGILVYFKDACLDISTRKTSRWLIKSDEYDWGTTGFIFQLGKFCIEYTGGIE